MIDRGEGEADDIRFDEIKRVPVVRLDEATESPRGERESTHQLIERGIHDGRDRFEGGRSRNDYGAVMTRSEGLGPRGCTEEWGIQRLGDGKDVGARKQARWEDWRRVREEEGEGGGWRRECWESRVNRGKEARGWLFQAAPRGCPSASPWQPTLKHPAVVAPSGFAFR